MRTRYSYGLCLKRQNSLFSESVRCERVAPAACVRKKLAAQHTQSMLARYSRGFRTKVTTLLKHVIDVSVFRGMCQKDISTFNCYRSRSMRTHYSHGVCLKSQVSSLGITFDVNALLPMRVSEK